MRIPVIKGIMDRRILINYRVDAKVMADVLPSIFRPKLVDGYAIAGICLIRLKQLHPRWFPFECGTGSENAAHRIAVQWKQDGGWCDGVYIPRRDTDSYIHSLLGGRLFPGAHHHASFDVQETDDIYRISLLSHDDFTHVNVVAKVADQLNSTSVFSSLSEASQFFEQGSIGYSATGSKQRFEGLELQCKKWAVQPLNVIEAQSSFFDDEALFPRGSVQLDCALLMRGIEHQWLARPPLCCTQSDSRRFSDRSHALSPGR